MSENGKVDLFAVRAGLEARKKELSIRLGQVEEELHSSHSQDFAHQATEREQDEVLEGEEVVFEQELAQIEAAITRIDNDRYGECAKCGGDIRPARLAVQPEAAFCIKCAS